jgi:signal peptidase II
VNRRNLAFGIVLLVSLVLDQGSKQWIYSNLAEGVDEITVIPGFFSLVHRQNPGAAFGMFREFAYRHYLFLGFTLVAAAFIFDMLRRPTDAIVGGVLGLILSGAFGNAIDRVLKQTVTDFLKVYLDAEPARAWLISSFGTNEWPSFNVADAALVVGVIAYVVYETFFLKKEAAQAGPTGDSAQPGA